MSTCSSRRHGYFQEAYRNYERQNPSYKLDHYVDQVAAAPPQATNLLDVGCGLGSFLERIAMRRPDLTLSGTDIDAVAVSSTRARVPDASVFEASAEDIPFPAESIDIVTAWDVPEHVADLNRFKAEVLRVLKRDGVFLFVVPVYDGLTGPLISRLDRDPTHVHKLPRTFWLDWAANGFDVADWHGLFRYLLGPAYLHVPTRLFRRASPAILVSCLRPG